MANDNPLSEEQIKTLNEIAALPPEQQKEKLPAFLKTLSPEQMEFLKKQQGQGGCPFCSIVEGKLQSKTIYEDDKLLAVLDIRPATAGHVLVLPKKHYSVLGQMNETETGQLFAVVNKIASLLFEILHAEGTNILVASGPAAGQTVDHVIVHVIPRFKDDGLQLAWEGKDVGEEKLNKILEQLKGQVKGEEKVVKEVEPVKEEATHAEDRMPDF